nr:MAG TPA: hypothetical protein [Caudoviricetes sp.]
MFSFLIRLVPVSCECLFSPQARVFLYKKRQPVKTVFNYLYERHYFIYDFKIIHVLSPMKKAPCSGAFSFMKDNLQFCLHPIP